jgi:hypothetical protein
MLHLLAKQQLDFGIFVVEPVGNGTFNRGFFLLFYSLYFETLCFMKIKNNSLEKKRKPQEKKIYLLENKSAKKSKQKIFEKI